MAQKPTWSFGSHRPWRNLAGKLGFVIVAGCVAAAGCGDGRPKRVPVAGVVLIDGKPLPSGEIMFVPKGTRPSSSQIDSEGRFNLRCFDGADGAVLGTHRIQVFSCDRTATKATWHAPKSYTDFRTSGLTHEVTGSDDNVVINLTWGGKSPKSESKN
jgi:hypothetical protein